jgi:hypothetical protein
MDVQRAGAVMLEKLGIAALELGAVAPAQRDGESMGISV